MGYGRFTSDDWTRVKSSTAGKTTAQNFRSTTMQDSLNPSTITRRESRDSALNPESTPVIIGADLTGSMGDLANKMLTDGCATLTTEIYNRKPVTDPHLLFAGIGDVAAHDRAPLQVTQFEADVRVADQLKDIYVERGGGGNHSESYHLPWYFAVFKTDTDSFKKRGRKGFIFTYGDEGVPPDLTAEQIKRVFGDDVEASMTTKQLLTMVEREWHVFHLMIAQGGHMNHYASVVKAEWTDLLGERAILVSDYTKMPEIIVSICQVVAGHDADAVAKSWSGNTAIVVRDAVGGMKGLATRGAAGGVQRL